MTNHPRVALVAPSLDILGGQSVQASSLLECLHAEQVPIEFLPINPPFPQGLQWLRRIRYARTVVNESLYAASLIRLRSADVVHVFCASYWSFLLVAAPVLAAARALRKPVVLNYHSGEAADHLARFSHAVHPWLRWAQMLVVPSEYLRGVFAEHGYAARVIPNVIDMQRYRYRERTPLRAHLLCARNLEAHYGVETTLRAFAQVAQRYPQATLTIAGHGTEARALHQMARRMRLARVKFLGRVAPSQMPGLYARADVLVNNSVIDNQPLSILQAFASGLPVVSTTPGDLATLLRPSKTGTVVAQNSPETTAATIMTLLEQPDLARAMARRAYEEIRRHSWQSVGPEWLRLYDEASCSSSAR